MGRTNQKDTLYEVVWYDTALLKYIILVESRRTIHGNVLIKDWSKRGSTVRRQQLKWKSSRNLESILQLLHQNKRC